MDTKKGQATKIKRFGFAKNKFSNRDLMQPSVQSTILKDSAPLNQFDQIGSSFTSMSLDSTNKILSHI